MVATLTLLSGCATAGSSCPPIVEYSQKEQQQLLDELEKLDGSSLIWWAMIDYDILREQLKVCHGD